VESEHLSDLLAQFGEVLVGPIAEHHEVVRVADQAPVRQVLEPPASALPGGGHRPARFPWRVQVLIEHRQRDVGQQRRQDAALRCAGAGVLVVAEFGEDPGLEERLDQPQHTLVLDPQPDPVHQGRMVDGVKRSRDTLPVSRRCPPRLG